MSKRRDHLLKYYELELNYLRRAGAEFAQKYPKVAQRLGLSETGAADPHVERLLEAFAFLTARIQSRVEADFPEMSQTMLGALYPHFVNPIPSMSVATFEVDPDLVGFGSKVRKHEQMRAVAETGEHIYFRTAAETPLWPVEVSSVVLDRHPELLDLPPEIVGCAGLYRIGLSSLYVRFEQAERLGQRMDSLRFFIHGSDVAANRIYEQIFCNLIRVVWRSADGKMRVLPKDSLREVGFGADEELLPTAPNSLPGYRLLQEYFAFPEKFRFFEVSGLTDVMTGDEGELLLLLNLDPGAIAVDRDTFRLHCCPVVNLFEHHAEPIRLDRHSSEYRLVGSSSWEREVEIHSVVEMMSASTAADAKPYAPFYAFRYSPDGVEQHRFFHTRRVPALKAGMAGTDVMVSFVDRSFRPTKVSPETVYAKALCTNRDLGSRVPPGTVLIIEEMYPIRYASLVLRPTKEIDPPTQGEELWMLVSHLTLNQLSLSTGPESVRTLRGFMKLYGAANAIRTDSEINGLKSMETRHVVRRLGGDAWRGFAHGTEVTLTWDERFFVGSTAFALSTVLSRFFAGYAGVNSFTELVIKSDQRKGEWRRWAPMAGLQPVL